jgi:predicted flap endonuclease-1-like 5' DNA nuclease
MQNNKKFRSPDFAKYIVTYLMDLKDESMQAKEEKKALEKMVKSGDLSKEEKKELRISLVQSKILYKAMNAVFKTAKKQLGYYSEGGNNKNVDNDDDIETEEILIIAEKEPKVNKPKAKNVSKKSNTNVNDLTLIEGIGPKIQDILNEAGIMTFSDLAASSYDSVKSLLIAAGPRFNVHDPKTWIKQASLAMNEKWDELRILQQTLKKGK